MTRAARQLLVLLAVAGCARAAEPEVRVLSRAVAPGEPLRIVVQGLDPGASVGGAFRDSDLDFVRDGDAFRAWAVVPLDAAPGPARLVVKAGGAVVERTLTIEGREFPEQRLTVDEKYVSPGKAALARIERERKRLDAIYAKRTPSPLPHAAFVRPVPGEPTSSFGMRRFFNGKPRSPHSGLDLKAATGTPVKSAGPGKVVLAADLYFSGNTVIVDHGGGLFTIYAHLSRFDVREGDAVEAGSTLGKSGATGRVTGPHLHWGAKIGETIFDPRALLDPALFGG